MQYHFRDGVTEEQKTQLKLITSSIKHKIGISLRSELIKINDKDIPYCVSSIDAFNNPLITICVSTSIFLISEQLVNILEFLASRVQTHNKQYFFSVNAINKEDIKVKIFPLMRGNYSKNTNKHIYYQEKDNCAERGYEFKIINNIIICVFFGNYEWKGKCVNSDSDNININTKSVVQSPFTLYFDKLYNITDQYNDLIKTITHENNIVTKNKTNKKEKDNLLQDYSLPKTLNVEVTKESKIISIKFTNCRTFDQLSNYLLKRFGEGNFFCEVDLETGEEVFKYFINQQ